MSLNFIRLCSFTNKMEQNEQKQKNGLTCVFVQLSTNLKTDRQLVIESCNDVAQMRHLVAT